MLFLDADKVQHAMAVCLNGDGRPGLRLGELARRMGRSRAWASQLITRAREGHPVTPATVGMIATALGVETRAITRERPKGPGKAKRVHHGGTEGTEKRG